MACADSRAPLSIDQARGEILCVPTWIVNIQSLRSPRGAQLIAFLNCLELFVLIAFMTIVEPSWMVRTNIFAISPSDQRKASTAFMSVVTLCTTSTQADTKGPKNS